MPRVHYLTIRCRSGCEAWLTPPWLPGHLARCVGHPWVDDLPDRAVVPAPLAGTLLSVLPRALVEEAERPRVARALQRRGGATHLGGTQRQGALAAPAGHSRLPPLDGRHAQAVVRSGANASWCWAGDGIAWEGLLDESTSLHAQDRVIRYYTQD